MGRDKEERSGVYKVTESGLEYQHLKAEPPLPKDGKEFLERFRNGFEMNVLEQKENELIFEMIGVDTSFANALRRILLSEVPTVAMEHVYMWTNTSIIHDEVLAHRLGLVPINIDARLFDVMEEGDEPTDRNTIVFTLKESCPARPKTKKNDKSKGKTDKSKDDDDEDHSDNDNNNNKTDEQKELEAAALEASKKIEAAIDTPGRPYTKHVYSRDLQWAPQGDQESRFPNGIRPVHDDILLVKLRPGQEIELEAHARRGIGKDHAKFSPVATASYRLFTEIDIIQPIYDELAEELVHLYEPGVFELVPSSVTGKRVEARVCNPYACTMSRNYMKDPILAQSIQMKRIPHHFVFSIESVGMQKPSVLLAEALRILQQKCQRLIDLAREEENAF